jgi:hypothetical protein
MGFNNDTQVLRTQPVDRVFFARGFWILDFGFWILDFGFWILDFGFCEHVDAMQVISHLKKY